MKLCALRVWNVRRFAERGVAIEGIGEGVNVLSAANEQGKSTCFDALHALFFQPYSGTPMPIRLLRPYSGGSPQIEADIETTDGRFRIAKQFYSGKKASITDIGSGRLVAQADEAESWIANLVRGGALGPTGLLWVRQGTTDIGTGTTREKEEERKAREDVLTSVAGEVEALTGGRRMVQIMERCETDLEKLITATGRAKAGGPYQLAIAQCDELKDEEQALLSRIEGLRTALDERQTKNARLQELNDPKAVAARRSEKEQTAKALEEANRHAEKLRAADSTLELESTRHQTAADALQRYDENVAQAAKLSEDLAAKEQALDKAKKARDQATENDAAAASAFAQVESKVETARTRLAQAQAAGRAVEASQQLSELKERLARAEESRQTVERLKAEADALALPNGIVAQLGTLEQEIAVMRATAKAANVKVAVKYAEGKEGTVQRDGSPLPDGEEQSIIAATELDITGVGVLSIAPGASGAEDRIDTSLEEAEEERRRLLSAAGVDSLAAARQRHDQAEEKNTALREAKAQLAALAPESLEPLRTRVTQLQTQAQEIQSDAPDPAEAEESLHRALEGQKEVRTGRDIAQGRMSSANEAFIRADTAVATARDTLAQTEATLGPPENREAERQKLAASCGGSSTALGRSESDS